mgnify:FL=1
MLCAAPSKSVLIPISDAHKNLFTFSWESGTDPNNKPIHNEFELDGEKSEQTSGLVKNVSFGNHEWKIKTCNKFCCSNYSSDSFNAYNNPPSKPIVNTSVLSGIVVLDWSSGIDPEEDSTYDEVELNEEIKKSVPPVIVTAEEPVKWKVRTCDIYGACSPWNDEGTFSCKVIEPICPTLIDVKNSVLDIQKSIEVSGGSGGGSGGGGIGSFVDIISELTKQVFVKQIDPEIIKESGNIGDKNIEDENIEEKAKSKNLIYLLLILSILVILVILLILYKPKKKLHKHKKK